MWTGRIPCSQKENQNANHHGRDAKAQEDHSDRALSPDRYSPDDHQSRREWERNPLPRNTGEAFNCCRGQCLGLGPSLRRISSSYSDLLAPQLPQNPTHEGPIRASLSVSPTLQYHHNIDSRCRNVVRGQGYKITLRSPNIREQPVYSYRVCHRVEFLRNNTVTREQLGKKKV